MGTSKFDQWLTTDPRDREPEHVYDEDRPYVAHLESVTAEGNTKSITTEGIDEWERLMEVGLDGRFTLTFLRLRFADGSELTVSRDGGPWGDGSNEAEHEDEGMFIALCNVCLDPIDYCQGHGTLPEADNPVEMGMYDDDPSPYDGNYSEM